MGIIPTVEPVVSPDKMSLPITFLIWKPVTPPRDTFSDICLVLYRCVIDFSTGMKSRKSVMYKCLRIKFVAVKLLHIQSY